MSSSNSPCAACKFLRRKCTQECVFAPYFPPDQPVKFANVHKVFGASNVAKILNELNASQREDAVNSLAYEAEARLRDPVYGCVGLISILQTRLKQVQTDLLIAKQELCTYIGQSPAMLPCLNPGFIQQYQNMQPSPATATAMASGGPGMHPNIQQMLTLQGPGNLRDAHHQQQQLYEAHQRQLVEAAREQEMLRNLEHQQRVQQQQQQQLQQQQHQSADLMRFNSGFDAAGPSGQPPVTPGGFTQLTGPATMSPSLALGGSYENNMYQIQQQHHRQPEHEQHHQLQQQHHQQPPHEHHQQLQLLPHHLMLQHQPQPQPPQQPPAQPQHGDGSEEGRSGGGPSC